uniref:Uncharacterized protein n=1 Tax=Romanomermis culicivorax TaxID=13658 RepID=A0A915IU97_ROMCU
MYQRHMCGEIRHRISIFKQKPAKNIVKTDAKRLMKKNVSKNGSLLAAYLQKKIYDVQMRWPPSFIVFMQINESLSCVYQCSTINKFTLYQTPTCPAGLVV